MSSRKQNAPGKARLITLILLFSFAWMMIFLRLVQIQVANGSEYGEMAKKQSTGKIKVKPDRGLFFDRKGRQVAINVIKNSLYAYPSFRSEIKNIKRYLSKAYTEESRRQRIKKSPLKVNRFRWLDRKLSDEMATQIRSDSIPGLYIREELGREYPFGSIGCQLIGATDIDGNGIAGLEYSFDSVLAGSPGLIDYLRDAKSNTYRINEIPLIKSQAGNSIVLSIDWQLQEIVEEELKAAVSKYNASEGMALFMDCRTGEILAASDCTSDGKTSSLKLKAVSNVFEPGSIFKVFTAAALLEQELVDTTEVIFCENGLWKCGRGIIRDDKKLDSLTFRRIFELSSNIGIGKLALRLGGENLVDAAKQFGFENRTLVGLPGEQAGRIGRPGVWSDYNIAALAMGHSISVTPLQLVTAVSAVANGGELMKPSVIRGIVNIDGDILKKNRPNTISRVISKDNAAVLRSFMAGVVSEGTATLAKSEIISIAGKTGTAEIYDVENGGYLKNKFNASFLGFFPVENPIIAGVVILNRPEPVHYGGHTSGPAFKRIAERYSIANSELIRPDTKILADVEDFEMRSVPDFIGQELKFAHQVAEKKGFDIKANLDSGMIVWQYPPEGRKIPGNEVVALMIVDTTTQKARMFDLKGMKIRTAIAVLNKQGLNFEIDGIGKVRKQFPKPGVKVGKSAVCRLLGKTS